MRQKTDNTETANTIADNLADQVTEGVVENATEPSAEVSQSSAEADNTAAENSEATGEPVQDDPSDSTDDAQIALVAAEKKAEDNWQLYLSARADADNIRKRAQRDVSNAHKYALEKFIPEMLNVKDSLELGAKAARESANSVDAGNEQLATFLEGSDMTLTMFNDALTKAGVTTIDPDGEAFNPELHQAMTLVPNPDVPANTVMEVVQKGYSLNERLLRPAMVIVSKAD